MRLYISLSLSIYLGCPKYFTLTETVLHLTTPIHFVCAEGELAMLSVRDFSCCCLSLHICKFVQSMLPEMGERNFPLYLVLGTTCLKLALAG